MSDWDRDCEALFAARREIDDEPSVADRRRIAEGIAAGVAIGAVSTSAAAHAKLVALAKIAVPLAIGVGTVTSVAYVASRPEAPRVVESAPPPSVSTSPRVVVAPPPIVADTPPPAPTTTTSAIVIATVRPSASTVRIEPPQPSATPSSAPAVSSAPAASDLAEEARMLRGVDEALRRGEYVLALRGLDDHDKRFPRGRLAEEFAAARVIATCGSTPGDASTRAACTFIAEHPHSTMRTRIREACAARCEEP
jgi:hypothetical protein